MGLVWLHTDRTLVYIFDCKIQLYFQKKMEANQSYFIVLQEWKVINPYNVRVRRKNPVTSKHVSQLVMCLIIVVPRQSSH